MPIVKQVDFGTERAPEWCVVRDGINAMGSSTREHGKLVELHFHDCDEFWFVVAGKARVTTDGEEHIVGKGDVVCTRMGEEHALLEVIEAPYTQVWIECALRGRKRRGHLHQPEDAICPPSP
ncbi:MAG: cupin domain-containing protein [Lentisphaerae bacterium]|jgi:mannose-6-phosphate isomerase-like protein (cupin superfamily)|nr:cupin domain-containing protein [Lentisphaerota bacterium]MBT5605322.1 cupin domain-containing protein [Lentisphaerota bacterium]MBT7055888.1 cupin domain-containing protein [Lentisphaerota bacterium]MBT7840944.1 cupin domain-containing protein [Lentisphaerota bacterium]